MEDLARIRGPYGTTRSITRSHKNGKNLLKAHMPTIFISYTSADKVFADKVGRFLTDRGATLWRDNSNIHPGDPLYSVIPKGIESSDFVVVVLSPAALDSWWVIEEANLALARKVPVVPLMLAKCEPPGFLLARLYLDFTSPANADEMYERLAVRFGLTTNASSTSTKDLLDLQRKFIGYSSAYDALAFSLAFAMLISMVGLACFTIAQIWLSARWLTDRVGIESDWPPLILTGIVLVLLNFFIKPLGLLNFLIPKLFRLAEVLYISFVSAPQMARTAAQANIDESLAVQAYESCVGTVCIDFFRRRLAIERARNKAQ